MRYHEFITERKKKRSRKTKLSRYFFPGFAYFGGSSDSGDGGGDGGGGESTIPKVLFNPKPTIREADEELVSEINQFVDWACKKLGVKDKPKIKLSYDNDEAKEGHHTGRYVPGDGFIWVYAKNRNLVDILRTVFHELVHVRQHENDQIKPGDSYPGSPIETEADKLAGIAIKIYGKMNRNIFQ